MEDKLEQLILQHNAELRHGFNELANGKTANEQTIAAILALILTAEVAARIDEINKVANEIVLRHDSYAQYISNRITELTKKAEVSL